MVDYKFNPEIDIASRSAKKQISKMLSDLGVSEKALDYVLMQKFYHRIPGLFCAWISDDKKRLESAELMIIHCVGLKMLDDIVDGDHDIGSSDLFLGAQLMQYAIWKLQELSVGGGINKLFTESYQCIYRDICKSNGRGDIDSYAAWIESASVQGGMVFATYGLAAVKLDGGKQSASAVSDFCVGFGRIIVLLDDFVDYIEKAERRGNIAYLYVEGIVSKKQLHDILLDSLGMCKNGLALTSPIYDLGDTVDWIYERATTAIEKFEKKYM